MTQAPAPYALPTSTATHALAPPARIRRDSASQRAFVGRALAAVDELVRFARGEGDLDARLAWLRGALAASPFWRERLRGLHLAPGDLGNLSDLAHFPTLERAELAAGWRDVPVFDGAGGTRADADGPDGARDGTSERPDDLVLVTSSGTTGEPVPVVRDRWDCLYMWAVVRFWLRWLGREAALSPRPRAVLLCALPGGLEYSVRQRLLGDGALHRISLRAPRAWERLARVRPEILFSDPAGLHELAGALEGDRLGLAPLLVLTSAQPFTAAQRQALAELLPAPVVNYYATTETGPIAWECLVTVGTFHLLVPDVWVESVAGELAVTRLRPGPTPLLRYLPGDRGDVTDDACPCGYRGRSIVRLAGRRACRFLADDGSGFDAWSLAWVFKQVPLRAFRLTQEERGRFTLELAGVSDPDAADLVDRLDAALVASGCRAPRISVRAAAIADLAKPEPFRAAGAAPADR